MSAQDQQVIEVLKQLEDGDSDALNRLWPLVHDELREIAARQMGGERANHTLQPTALVHEVYLRLCDRHSPRWRSRAHFLSVAAQATRRILVEYARARGRDKRGAGWIRVTLTDQGAGHVGQLNLDVLALDLALERLGRDDDKDRRVVELRFFGGLTNREVAHVLGVTERTIERRWRFARSWLYRELGQTPADDCPDT